MRGKSEFRLNSADRKIIEAGANDLSLFTQYYFDGWEPLPYQEKFYHSPQKDKLIIAGIRTGKGVRLSEPILTISGWKQFGELVPGDYVFGMDGRPTEVTEVHPVLFNLPCYEVVFSDGATIPCWGDHLWLTWSDSERRGRTIGPNIRTTELIHNTLTTGGQVNYSVPNCKPLVIPEVDLPFDPYLLGLWLGDGSSGGYIFTTADTQLLESFQSAGLPSRPLVGKCYDFAISGLREALLPLGVINNKHVPPAYLLASEQQRRALLAGLLDTDGSVHKSGLIRFVNTNENLISAVQQLFHSLGIKTTTSVREAGKYGINHSRCWTVHATPGPDTGELFRLSRKQGVRTIPNGKKQNYRYIIDVRPIPSEPMRCITVAAEDGMFLVGHNLIPTHNSKGIAAGFCHFAFYNPKSRLANACISADQSLVVFNDVIDFISRKRFDKFVEHVEKHPYPKIVFVNQSELWFRSTGYEAEYWRGWEFDWINVDEAAYIDKKLTIDVLKGRLIGVKNVNGLTVPRAGIFTMTSSPKGKSWLFDRWKKGDPNYPEYDPDRYLSMRARSRDNIHISPEQWDQLEADYTERMIRQELEGLFLDSEDTVFPYEHIMNICAEDQSAQIAQLNNQVAISLGSDTIEKKDISYYSLPPEYGHVYINSWDIGKKPTKSGRNAMVGGVLDITEKPWKLVAFRYFPGATYGMAQEWIVEWQKKYSYNCYCDTVIDASGKGDPINERLETENNIPVDGIVYTPVIKPQMIMSLQMAMEKRWMIIPFVKVIVDQLQSYELDDRKIAQDCVMMLAQATYRARERSSDYNPQYSSYEKNIVSSYRSQKELHERFVARRKAGRGRRTAW